MRENTLSRPEIGDSMPPRNHRLEADVSRSEFGPVPGAGLLVPSVSRMAPHQARAKLILASEKGTQ
jgi:hypothetical protein